jgi:hypothetical protein
MTIAFLPPAESVLSTTPDGFDDEFSIDDLGAQIVGTAGRIASATCRWLLLVAEFDARDGCARYLLPSTARWLAHYCGISGRTAAEHARVARALAAHPVLAEAMAAGRISYSHARAITRVAELGDAGLVAGLVNVAEHGSVGQLELVVRGLRTVDRNADGADPERDEKVSHRWRDDSYLGLSAKLDPEHGALVLSAIEIMARREDITHAAALSRLAEIGIATLNASDAPAPWLRGSEYAAIMVHVDADRLPVTNDAEPAPAEESSADPQPEVEGRSAEPIPGTRPAAQVANGPGLPDATVARLLCTGRIRVVVTSDHPDGAGRERYRWRNGVLDVGANRRLVSDKQFRALLIREDGCCSVPGCGSQTGLEAHHVRHWYWGGKTIMANLVLLCRAHHHAVHDDVFRIVSAGHQRFRYLLPDGREIPKHIDPSEHADPTWIEDEHAAIAPTAATTRWDGTRLDREYAVAALAQDLRSVHRWRERDKRITAARKPAFDPWERPPRSTQQVA